MNERAKAILYFWFKQSSHKQRFTKNADFDNHGSLTKNAPAIVPKHCCVWKREWEDSDIIYQNTISNNKIRIYKNPYTNTFRITTNAPSVVNNQVYEPQEDNLKGEDGNLKNGVYKFVACPNKNNQLKNKINQFEDIRNGCKFLTQEIQKVNLVDNEMQHETELEANIRIKNNDKQIKELEDNIKKLYRYKVQNTIVKQNINRLKLTEVNRK